MTLLILGNAVVWNGSKVKNAIDVVDQAEKLITNYPNLVIHQNIWSFEINFLFRIFYFIYNFHINLI